MIIQIAKELALYHAGEILDYLGIPWWLEAGTALGAVREKDFIKHDKDIDLGVAPGHTHRWDDIIREFYKRGWSQGSSFQEYKDYKLRLCFKMDACPADDPYAKFKKPMLDIFFFYEAGEKWWMGITGPPPEGGQHADFSYFLPHVFSSYLFQNMETIDLVGHSCLIPSPPEEYLNERYGESWRTPQENYYFWKHCKAIVSIKQWEELIQ